MASYYKCGDELGNKPWQDVARLFHSHDSESLSKFWLLLSDL